MLNALTRIDQLSVADHWHLTLEDEVYFFGEYSARKGYEHSEINQLITNLKHRMEYRNTARWPHKLRAIQAIGDSLSRCLSDAFLREATRACLNFCV